MSPKVSVVIPTYNRAEDLSRALDSVLNQSFTDFEVIVVDNHSTDATDEMVAAKNDPRIQLFKVHNKGVIAVSRNLGISKASGEFIAFLDSDDWWCPEKLEESLKSLEAGHDIVYHDLFLVRSCDQNRFRVGKGRDLSANPYADMLTNGNPLQNSSVVVRSSLLREIGHLSEDADLIAMEDFDAWLRIARITSRFAKIGKTLGYYWIGGGNVSNPTRKLKVLSAFEGRYSEEIERVLGGHVPWWIRYEKGRSHYLLGNLPESRGELAHIRFSEAPRSVSFKAWVMRASMLFKS